ncbi:AlbA family DNA-binding domain-containing protein [Kitasatospora griseola]|uniref:AlbA family DNA-binding domain-containing protein n=1 Tax=Kitasatospora griseola TaxID=2064 RepID=UPI0037FDDB49
MVMRSRRLEDLIGGRLDALTYSDIADLVNNPDAAEREDLDYKQAHYAKDEKSKGELAKDIAAFANHTGGLLVLGMAETGGVPSKLMDVALNDQCLREIRQAIASSTAPPVPYEAIPVPNPESPGNGFLLLAVPRSPLGPHAVTAAPSREALRYPRRGGSKTEWLTETDVATAYRSRFAAAAERDQRLTDVEEDLIGALASRRTPHLIVTLVPEVPGEMVVDSARFDRYRQEVRSMQFYLGQSSGFAGDVTVGARRLHARQIGRGATVQAELHRDGSAAIAIPLHHRLSILTGDKPDWQFVEPGNVVYHMLCALPFLAGHARDRAAASGTAQVKASMVVSVAYHPSQRLNIDIHRPEPLPFTVDFVHPATGEREPTSTQACDFAHSLATVLLDDAADHGTGLLQATAALADELLHAYGLPDNRLISREGQLNTHLFGPHSHEVTRWATQNGLLPQR